jgi:ABC-type branched-subunit amino acid transport system ATPase component
VIYNLSILCVDGETIYGMISSNKNQLMKFLNEYDHEGSSLTLIKHEGSTFVDVPYDVIYEELKGEITCQ